MAELMKCPEYNLKVPLSELSVKRASDISNDLIKKKCERVVYILLCIMCAFIVLFSKNLIIIFEATFGLGFLLKTLMEKHKDMKKFAEKEFIEFAMRK